MKTKHYLGIVRDTLMAEWKQDAPPSGIDLDTAIKLLAKLALKSTTPESFVKKSAYTFKEICKSGFPFASANLKQIKIALRSTLELGAPILFHYLTSNDNWMDEQELESLLEFQKLQIDEIASACHLLQQLYSKNNDFRAGYYFLWLLKKAAGCTFNMPEKQSFDRYTIAKTLEGFLENADTQENPVHFIEILLYLGGHTPSFKQILNSDLQSKFLNFTLLHLKIIPMDDWSNKNSIILRLMEIVVDRQNKLIIANTLALSEDPNTAQVGHLLAQTLQASNLNQALPHLHALAALLPGFRTSNAEFIFQLPFPSLLLKLPHFSDPEFIKRLNDRLDKVMVHGTTIIGRYTSSWGIPPMLTYLLAYDKDTEKLIWGTPLHNDYKLKRHGEHLALQFKGENRLQLLDPTTGATISTIAFPKLEKGCDDCRQHLGPNGFAYQAAYKGNERTLSIGSIQEDQWIPISQQIAPRGEFLPLSTHCGFYHVFEKKLIVIAPTGDRVTLDHCLAVEDHEDKLYTIEKDPHDQNKCLLKVRRLHTNQDVLSTVEYSLSIRAKKAAFGKFCPNEQLILFANERALFINLKSQEITYSDHKIEFAEMLIDAKSCAVWTWDQGSNRIGKITSTESILMGSLYGGRYLRLVHVDNTGRLYIQNSSRS